MGAIKWYAILIILMVAGATGCATNDNYLYDGEPDDNSRAHPAAYLTEAFPVHRPLPKHDRVNTPFYFKTCSPAGERWPISKTSYDCDYP